MNNKEVIEFITNLKIGKSKREIYLKNHHIEIYKLILEKTKFLDSLDRKKPIRFQERYYCIEHNIHSPVLCPICNKNPLDFRFDTNCYRKHCSISCAGKDQNVNKQRQETKLSHNTLESINEKIKRTRFEKYGGYSPKDWKDKLKKTYLERYGVENYSNVEKIKETCRKKYGVEYPGQIESSKEKQKKTMLKKYGVSCSLLLPSTIEKTKKGIRERAWKYLSKNTLVEPLFTKDEFFNIDTPLKENRQLKFKCKKCGNEFQSRWYAGVTICCPKCITENHGSSNSEHKIIDFIKSIFPNENVVNNDKTILENNKEIDIVIPSKHIGIEYNGLYWHNSNYKEQNYHINKIEECKKHGIKLIHIFENEWLSKQEIVKSRIRNILGVIPTKIYARNCQIKELSENESESFLIENHLQGNAKASVRIGLLYNNEIVSVMTFSKPRFNKNIGWELLRFANKLNTTVIGGASKLLKYFEQKYNPKSIISYADRRWSNGNLYEKLGFNLNHISSPNYWYFKPNNPTNIYNRIQFQKHKLKNILKIYDKDLSEYQNMENNGYLRIYDCGNLVYVKNYG